MSKLKKEELERKIETASPLEFVSILQNIEQYEKEETKVAIDELCIQFATEDDMTEKLVVPIFTSIIDGFLEMTSATRKLRKKGITASRLVSECRSFSYEQPGESLYIPDGYTEYKNIQDVTNADFNKYGDNIRPKYEGQRKKWEDKQKLNKYKENIFANNGEKINATDEYTGENNIYKEQAHPDARRNIAKYKHKNQAHVDHIEPLSKIHERLKGNYALSDEDIKNIANSDYNFALTAAYINNGTGMAGQGSKSDMTISEFIADQERRERNGEPHLKLTKETKTRMLEEEKKANVAINRQTNKTIAVNIFNPKDKKQQKKILETNTKNAWNQSKDYMIGNVILFIIKPLYYEITDIFYNGLKEGVNATTVSKALYIRFGRIKNFVLSNALNFLGTSVWDFVKGFVSSLIESFISLFVGMFKQILKIIKEGIKIFTQAGKVLFGEQAKQMSAAQKGDAIIKILGGSVIAICGVGIESLLNKIGIGEPYSVVLSTMLSGIASALFMFTLDNIDLFNTKAETRQKRINDIFNERIQEIKETTTKMNEKVMSQIKQQRLGFNNLMRDFNEAKLQNDYTQLNNIVIKQALFLGISLPPIETKNTKWEM